MNERQGGSTTVSRRTFVCAAAAGAATAGLAGAGARASERADGGESQRKFNACKPVEATVDPKTGKVTVNEDVIVRYSACLGCYSSCGNCVRIDRATGEAISAGGNPYNPNNAYPYLNFDEPLESAYLSMSQARGGQDVRGTICGRGNATFDAYAQPDRITVPLKRAGKRGEGKWEPISWDQLITEVVEGGKLFEDIGEDREIEGLRALHSSEKLISEDDPEFGPVANQVACFGSRGDGRSQITSRFGKAFGTLSMIGHGATCGGSENPGVYANMAKSLCSDITEAEYIIWCGTFPGANGKSMQGIAQWAADALAKGTAKMDVLDPALGSGVATAASSNIRWIPIRTATNAAFGLAMLRIIIDEGLYNATFLSFPTQQAALDGGYAAFSDASYLVITDETHPNFHHYLRGSDIGWKVAEGEEDPVVVMDAATGKPVVIDECAGADFLFDGEVEGVHVRSAFQMMSDSAHERTVEELAAICEVPAEEIARMAHEFTSHGTKASVTGIFGGTAQVNGIDASMVYHSLNAMVGSNNMRGGMVPRRSAGDNLNDASRYLLGTVEGAPKRSGISIERCGMAWQDTSEYARRVAAGEKDPTPKLPWYPVPGDSDNQAIVSVANAYPYQTKVMITWMADTLQASSGAMREQIVDLLKDPDVVPLAITCDVFMGEHAQLSDYFVPDTTPYESFGIRTQEGYWNGKGNTVRWQVVEPKTMLLEDGRHASYEAFVCDVAERLGLPGFGADAIKGADGSSWPLNDACDFFLKGVANLAYSDDDPVDDITDEEVHLQGLDSLPEAWKAAVTEEEWPKVLKVLSRGGRFWPIEQAYDDKGRSAYAASFQTIFFNESRASGLNSYTGETGSGVLHWKPECFADESVIRDTHGQEDWPFTSTNYKPRFRSISMLANSPVMRDMCAENYIEMNADDAAELGIAAGDTVRVENPTGDVMVAPAMPRAGIARHTFAVAYGYGHIAYGSQDVQIGDELRAGDPAIAAGVHLQTMLDPTVEGVFPIADPEAATPGRSGGVYRIAKA